MTEAISDFHASPWWPCPECGGEEFYCLTRWERGQWQEWGDGWEAFDPPRGVPSTVDCSEAKCATCGTATNLFERYEWEAGS